MSGTKFHLSVLAVSAGLWWMACQASDVSRMGEGLTPSSDTTSRPPPAPAITTDGARREIPKTQRTPSEGTAAPEDRESSVPPPLPAPRDLSETIDRIMGELIVLSDVIDPDRSPRVLLKVTRSPEPRSARLDKEWIANRLRVELNRAANGRLFFIDSFLNEMEKQRNKKGADYHLEGRLSPVEAPEAPEGKAPPPTWEISFRMLGAEAEKTIWSGSYEFREEL